MRKNFFIILSVFLCFLLLSFVIQPVESQEIKSEERKINTTGESKIWIEADRARVYLGIETLNETVDIARQENAIKITKVLEALKALSIEGMLVKAPAYNVSLVKEQDYDATRQGRLPKILGYKVVQDFTVLLQNKDAAILSKNAGLVVDTALNNGVNLVQNIEFFKEDDSIDKRQATSLAVKDAIANANAIAEAAGVSVKDYVMIETYTNYWYPVSFRQTMQQRALLSEGEAGGGATTLIAGRIAITSHVKLSCTIK